jgi:hypothetical protein
LPQTDTAVRPSIARWSIRWRLNVHTACARISGVARRRFAGSPTTLPPRSKPSCGSSRSPRAPTRTTHRRPSPHQRADQMPHGEPRCGAADVVSWTLPSVVHRVPARAVPKRASSGIAAPDRGLSSKLTMLSLGQLHSQGRQTTAATAVVGGVVLRTAGDVRGRLLGMRRHHPRAVPAERRAAGLLLQLLGADAQWSFGLSLPGLHRRSRHHRSSQQPVGAGASTEWGVPRCCARLLSTTRERLAS